MQNTVIKEFENNPEVEVFIMQQGGWFQETYAWAKTFWNNYYLRCRIVYDPNGAIGWQYDQPYIGIPFGRSVIINRDGTVHLPIFGHQPRLVIQEIYKLLGKAPVQPKSPVP